MRERAARLGVTLAALPRSDPVIMDNLKLSPRAAECLPDTAFQKLSSLRRHHHLVLNCMAGNCNYSYVVLSFTLFRGGILPLLGVPIEANAGLNPPEP